MRRKKNPKENRASKLNKRPRAQMPKGCVVAGVRQRAKFQTDAEAMASSHGDMIVIDEKRIFGLGPKEAVLLGEELEQARAYAMDVFTKNEGIPDRRGTQCGWSARGVFGECRTKAGHLACELLYHLEQFRQLSDAQSWGYVRCWCVYEIGRLYAMLQALVHEENASLGGERRRINRQAAKKKSGRMTKFLEESDAEELFRAMVRKGHTRSRALELVSAKLVPPWRGKDGSPISAATLARHGIGKDYAKKKHNSAKHCKF